MDTRDPAKDYDLYKETCEDLQRLMAEIHELKSKGGKDAVSIQLRYCMYKVTDPLNYSRILCSMCFTIVCSTYNSHLPSCRQRRLMSGASKAVFTS